MKAFLSHSSVDKELVLRVYDALKPQTVWLDRAEIEWGRTFIGKIEEGIKTASDFVLFWSTAAAKSEWVSFELNMALIQMLKEHAIRLRVVRLDQTELPLHLQPFHYLSVSESPDSATQIIAELKALLGEPTQGVRHRFLNRNSEFERLESLMNDLEIKVIILHGFRGIGKAALANEAFRRFFDSPSVVEIAVDEGMGPAELALRLSYEVDQTVPGHMATLEALAKIEYAMKTIVERGQFIIFRDAQHWLDGEGEFEEPLPTVIRQAITLSGTARHPVFLTSSRRLRIPSEISHHTSMVRVNGLSDDHMASLITLWFELFEGAPLKPAEASKIAPALHGHPVAAKPGASLVAQYGADYLQQYPVELIELRLDLAKTLLRDLQLRESASSLMETLSMIGMPVPSKLLATALDAGDNEFQDAVMDTTRVGIVEAAGSGNLMVHPLVADYFWRSHLHHEDYKKRSAKVAAAVYDHFCNLPSDSADFVSLLPVVVRLYAQSGDLAKAREIRRDLTGELSRSAITHYRRRQYDLAESFIRQILEDDPDNWKMRLYLVRIHIRRHRWNNADALIDTLLTERPQNFVVEQLRAWRLRRAECYEKALDAYVALISQRRDNVTSLREAAYCLYRLNRTAEALDFLERAKLVESDNAYVLDLEARIYEEMGKYDQALIAARVAVLRDPVNWSLRHRLARILNALERHSEALSEAREAVRLDPEQFTALSSLVAFLLDAGQQEDAGTHLDRLEKLAANEHERQILGHIRARVQFQSGDHAGSLELVENQIYRGVNLAASYGLVVQIKLAQYEQTADRASATARLLLEEARRALASCKAQPDHNGRIVEGLKRKIEIFSA